MTGLNNLFYIKKGLSEKDRNNLHTENGQKRKITRNLAF